MAITVSVVLLTSACTIDRATRSLEPDPRPHPKGPTTSEWKVTRVVDGDTVEVQRATEELTIRLIGIDTPETVHPTEPVECYGPEASQFADRRLLGRTVTLELDRSQGRLDDYGRTLAYLWLGSPPTRLFNRAAVRKGFAFEYTYDSAYLWQSEFIRAAAAARHEHIGVWRCPDPGS